MHMVALFLARDPLKFLCLLQSERLKAIGPKDEADKAVAALIDKGTSEELLGPDWQSSFELVDLVNSQPQ
eukprot:540728-Pelagomonas_calceolata.AAC.1